MSRQRIDQFCESGIFWLVLVILAFGPLAAGAVHPMEFLAVLGLTAGVMLLWIARLWFGEQRKLLWPPVCWAVLAFAAYALIRYFTADIEYVGRWELLRVLVYTALFFAVLNNLHHQDTIQRIVIAALALGALIAVIAAWQFLAKSDKVPSLGAFLESLFVPDRNWYYDRIYVTRGSGTYINPNHLAGLLEMLLPLGLAYTLTSRCKTLTKVFLGYAALAIVAGIGVSVSRGSWVAAGFVVLLFFAILAIHNTYRVPSLVMMFIMLMGCSYFVTKTEFFKQRFIRTFAKGRIELDVRYQLWESTVQMWQDHYWFGVGPGHYDHRFRAYRPEEVQLNPDRAHNEYLNLLSDWGVTGAALVGVTLLCLFVGVARTWKHVRKPESDFSANLSNRLSFFLGSFLGLLALLIHSTVDFNMQLPANAILAFCLAALLSSQLKLVSERYWINASGVVKILVSLAVVAFVSFAAASERRLFPEAYFLDRAENQLDASPEQISLMERAIQSEPRNCDSTFAIADAYMTQSKAGSEDYRTLATNAITWFERSIELNPFNGYSYAGCGWCWDWIALRHEDEAVERALHEKAEGYFIRAESLDPKGYYMVAQVALHFAQTENWAAVRAWSERSLRLQRKANDIALSYLSIANRKLEENATNRFQLNVR